MPDKIEMTRDIDLQCPKCKFNRSCTLRRCNLDLTDIDELRNIELFKKQPRKQKLKCLGTFSIVMN